MNDTPLISIHNANIINGEEVVIFDLDMDVYESDFVYIVGKVGTGKTQKIRSIPELRRSAASTWWESRRKTSLCCAARWASYSRISSS